MAIRKTTAKKAPAKKSNTASISIGLGTNKAEMRKWEIESAMSTLKRAAEIQNDSKLMSDGKQLLGLVKRAKILKEVLMQKVLLHIEQLTPVVNLKQLLLKNHHSLILRAKMLKEESLFVVECQV
jgi:hypothetical protein